MAQTEAQKLGIKMEQSGGDLNKVQRVKIEFKKFECPQKLSDVTVTGTIGQQNARRIFYNLFEQNRAKIEELHRVFQQREYVCAMMS